jgi:hypothetical protein
MPNLVLPQGSIASFLNDDVEQLVGLSDRTLQLPSIRCKSEGRTLRYQLEPRRRFLACRPQNHNGGSRLSACTAFTPPSCLRGNSAVVPCATTYPSIVELSTIEGAKYSIIPICLCRVAEPPGERSFAAVGLGHRVPVCWEQSWQKVWRNSNQYIGRRRRRS